MSEVHVAIDSLQLSDFDGDEASARAKLDAALSLLAARLTKSPFARMGAKKLALAELELGELTTKDLASPSGAEKLADALYRALERSLA